MVDMAYHADINTGLTQVVVSSSRVKIIRYKAGIYTKSVPKGILISSAGPADSNSKPGLILD